MARPVRHRVVARVLPVNAAGEVLLLHDWHPVTPDVHVRGRSR